VTDDLDKVLLNTYCKVWFGEHMFSDKFSFYTGQCPSGLNRIYALGSEVVSVLDINIGCCAYS